VLPPFFGHFNIRRIGLRSRLVLFGTLLTSFVVIVTFVAVNHQISANTRQLLAEELAESQRLVLEQGRLTREQLLRTSGLITDNSTLRAALETFRLESAFESRFRPDLLATIGHEVEKIAEALGKDLLVVTDDEGIVLASSDREGRPVTTGANLGLQPVVQVALNQDAPVGEQNFALLDVGGRPFQVICVPIVLQGYIIGTLIHGDLVDQAFISRMQDLLGGEIVMTVGGSPAGSTLAPEVLNGSSFDAGIPQSSAASGEVTIHLGREEFVAASMALGTASSGQPVRLHLLHSLTRRLAQANRSLLLLFLAYGTGALAVAVLLATIVSRSILRPLKAFVEFMRSVGVRGDLHSRFREAPGSPEVATLNEAYDQMMDSLERTREQLSGARQDLQRMDRLKEAEKMAALGRMLSGAAHEINNPLSAVVGNIELLMNRESLDEYIRDRLGKALKEGRRVAALVKNLLKLSHRSDEKKTDLDLNKIIRECLSVCQHDFSSADIAICEELAPGEVMVLGSELELQQVFLNLFRNALDAMTEQGIRGALIVSSSGSGDRVSATVADEGPGISDLVRLFDPFFTTKEIGKGTGLGLSICQGIAESHGGTLTAANRSGGGAVFTLALPRHEGSTARDSPAAAPEGEQPSPSTPRPMCASVLVVDDEPSVVELQVDLLTSQGARVTTARSGREALDHLADQRFDLVITDLRMPGGVSGKDLYEWIRRERPGDKERVVFVTGDTMGEDSQCFLEGLTNRCLVKPFSIREYVELLEEVLHEQEAVC
jgi:signal transduction histidine kinase